MDAIRIVHSNRLVSYGLGWFHRILPEPGHACVSFDIDDGVERRVLTRDITPLSLRERAAEVDRRVSEMMGHDPHAVTRCLREVQS